VVDVGGLVVCSGDAAWSMAKIKPAAVRLLAGECTRDRFGIIVGNGTWLSSPGRDYLMALRRVRLDVM
jgi:hypothetical protein